MWVLFIPPILLAVIIHEVAHGWAAYKLGDSTAFMLGRLSLNPVKHVDPLGTVIFPLLQIVTTGSVMIAWAKPVPVNVSKFRKPFEAYAIVAAAGPASNFVQAMVWAIPIWLLVLFELPMEGVFGALIQMSMIGINVNLALMVFNLLPGSIAPPLS